MPSERIKDIQNKIKIGWDLKKLQSIYPITQSLFLKLGGKISLPSIPIRINEDYIQLITGKDTVCKNRDETELDHDVIIGSLLSDGNIYHSKQAKTCSFSIGHTFAQIGYVKLKYELLKPYVTRIRMCSYDGMKDYSFHISLKSLLIFRNYYDLFYIAIKKEKTNPAKYIMNSNIIDKITPRVFAFWLMDDGSRYGKSLLFNITIGKQSYYSFKSFQLFVGMLSEKLGWILKAHEDKSSYTIIPSLDSIEQISNSIYKWIWPDFYYKLGVFPEELGQVYHNLQWFLEWEKKKCFIEHPFLKGLNLSNYKTKETFEKEQFQSFLFNRTIVRGFPFYYLSNSELEASWNLLKKAKIREEGKILTASIRANVFPNSFMNHRFKVRVNNKPSPYELFLDRKHLRKTLNYQLNHGSNLRNSNIRNALGYYGAQVAGQFNPCYMKFFIAQFCIGKMVLDPCAGWGGRLAGTVANGKSYYGIEPENQTYKALCSMKEWLVKKSDSEIVLVQGCAEDSSCYDRIFDFALTSPPYFNREQYSDSYSQSWKKYPEYGLWKECFLKPLIVNVHQHLIKGGYFVLNIADVGIYKLVLDTMLLAQKLKFELKDVYKVRSYRTNRDFGALSETFLVLKKG